MKTNYFGQMNGRFSVTDEDPLYGSAFHLEAVQLVNINGDYTDWISLDDFSLDKYSKESILSVGKNMNEWKKIRKQISDDYCNELNFLTKGNIIPFKQMVALKIQYIGKSESHVFHYYTPRNP